MKIGGIAVRNATAGIVLSVSKGDVAKSDRKEPGNCAIARSCRRTLHPKDVRVHLSRVYIRTDDNEWVRYITPKYLRAEIIAFDRGGEFLVGKYELSPPEPSKQTGKRQSKSQSNTKTTKRQRGYRLTAGVRADAKHTGEG